jgi:hypothetical protein
MVHQLQFSCETYSTIVIHFPHISLGCLSTLGTSTTSRGRTIVDCFAALLQAMTLKNLSLNNSSAPGRLL